MCICAIFIIWEVYRRDFNINKVFDSTINKKLCAISPELYFFHMPICAVIGENVENSYLRAGMIVVSSFGVAIMFNMIHKNIRKRREI